MMFGRMHTIKWDPGILFPNGMSWRALLIVGVQCQQWALGYFLVPLIPNSSGNKHYGTWDPHLCHWSIFYWSLESCMHLEMVVYLLGGISIFMIF